MPEHNRPVRVSVAGRWTALSSAVLVAGALAVAALLSGSAQAQAQAAPLNQSPPTIILHGGLDPLVAPSQSQMLKDLLTASGVPNEYVFYPNEFHGWSGANMVHSFDRIAAFLALHVN